MKNVDIEIYVSQVITFFEKNPNDLMGLIGGLQKDEFYLNDLLGCSVINTHTKEKIGIIESFYENGEQVVLQVKTENSKIDILFINNFVHMVDIKNQIIEVTVPEFIE